MKEIKVIGLDLAKNVFQVCGLEGQGKVVLSRRLRRGQVMEFFAKLPPVKIGIEACGGAHEWARRLEGLGHEVKMMAPQYVKAYVKRDKSDARDAQAIAIAALQATVPEVVVRTVEQQQLQSLHRARERFMKHRVSCTNELRGLLGEFGEVMPKGDRALREGLSVWQGRAGEEMALMVQLVAQLVRYWDELVERISGLDKHIAQLHRADAYSCALESIDGVGVLSASATRARFGRAQQFKSARHFSSALGLVPRQHSSGEKVRLLGISKRGDSYIRRLLVHGARAVLNARLNRPQYAQDWVVRLAKRRGYNIATVALAAKNARRIWALLQSGEHFDEHYLNRAACAS
jgi:transposase